LKKQGLTGKDQDKDKVQTHKDQTLKDKDKDSKSVLKDSLRTKSRTKIKITAKDLGAHVCSDLSFATHVNTSAAKAHSRVCLIHEWFISRDAVTLTRAFVAYVRPILEYASVIWSPYHVNQISKLESVQRRFPKRIAGLRDMPYVERLKKLQLESLETRGLRNDLQGFIWACIG